MMKATIYTNWWDWGLGVSVDLEDPMLTIDFGPWDIEFDFTFEKLDLPPEFEPLAKEWNARIKADPEAAGTKEFIEFSKQYRDAITQGGAWRQRVHRGWFRRKAK